VKNRKIISAGVVTLALLVTACSQDTGAGADPQDSDAQNAAQDEGEVEESKSADLPAPFDEGGVKIALVQNSGAGDYFQQYLNGSKQQADAMDVELDVYDAQADDAKQVTDMETAIGSDVDGIIVRHGHPDTMCPLINKALEADIPVVIYDVATIECAPDAVETAQSDADLAETVLAQMAEDIGPDQNVGYVNVYGIAPLDRRDVVWKEYLEENNWNQEFFTGKFTNAVATDNAPLVDAAIKANSDVTAIFAPYDELTKATVSAIEQNNLNDQIVAYGVDISNADIEVMTAENSPWVATATTDPNAIGAAVMRTMFLELAGELDERQVTFPGVLVTQEFLLENEIQNMEDLRGSMPELHLTDEATSDWISTVSF